MSASPYLIGVVFAILSGIFNNFGTVLQKKVVNDHKTDEQFMKNLVKSPLWMVGLLLQLAIGTIFFMFAQLYIGPALIPGLMAGGLIILAIGSVYIVGESLHKSEIIGIGLMIIAITFLGFSELSIDIINTDLLEVGFIVRVISFTLILTIAAFLCKIIANRTNRFRGIALAVLSGFMFSLSNFWISPLMGVIAHIFEGSASIGEIILFICASVILVITNVFGLTQLQKAFKEGQASNLIPIQQVPIQITPIFIYFLVFLLIAPNMLSVIFMLIGVSFIVMSSFILGKRQSQIEEIK